MGFCFPTASPVLGVHYPGLASPGTFRFQVFSTPYRLAPPCTLRVCFTPLTLLGFLPPEPSPRDEQSASSVARCPLGIAFLMNRCPRNLDSSGASDFDLGFVVDGPVGCLQGFPPVCELVVSRTVLPVAATRCSPGLYPSLGSSPSRRWPGLHRASSHVLVGGTSQVALVRPHRLHFRVSLHRDGGFSLSRTPYPSEVSRLLLSHRFGKGRSGVMVSPRVRAYVASRAGSLFGPFPFPCRSPM
jgi:hypothetical protein